MKVVSTNIGKRTSVDWNGKVIETGIYKFHKASGINLKKEDVESDQVIDRKHHGGVDKACYAFGSDSYPVWQELYPDLKFDFGMFGENLTIEGLCEKSIQIGSQYEIGEAIVEVSEPRTPCFKLGIRFGDQTVLKHFIKQSFSGIYFRVLKEGLVKEHDEVRLIKSYIDEPTVYEVHFSKFGKPDEKLKLKVLNSKFLSQSYLQG